jgi:hypothetical protein
VVEVGAAEAVEIREALLAVRRVVKAGKITTPD